MAGGVRGNVTLKRIEIPERPYPCEATFRGSYARIRRREEGAGQVCYSSFIIAAYAAAATTSSQMSTSFVKARRRRAKNAVSSRASPATRAIRLEGYKGPGLEKFLSPHLNRGR